MSKNTKLIRAPKDIVNLWRINFPKVHDQDMIRIMWKTSPISLENSLRNLKRKT